MNRASQVRQKRTLVLLAVSHRALAGAIEDALLHYWIGMRTYGSGLPVDGWHVAQRMAEALEAVTPGEEDAGASA
jgi:hypothetical protein